MRSLTPSHRAETLSQLRSDQSERWRRGERILVEHYLRQSPQLDGDAEALLELLRAEILLRRQMGDVPTLDEYLHRFPAFVDALRELWASPPPVEANLSVQTNTGDPVSADAVTDPRVPDLAPGVRIPGFEMLEKVGEGGMGVVFKARQRDLDRLVALKLLRAGPLAGEQLLARFHVEEKAVARLDHPGVVRIHSTGQHEGWVYFCMEFVPGGSLAGRLRGGPLDVRRAAEVVWQLALAIQHAHDAGVLHRDLKPANVLLAADGQTKVSDFGLAKLLDADDGLTQSGALLGTPSYLAPEQARGQARDVGPPVDVYALGAVLYECLTGRPPFRGATRSETLELVKAHPPQPPRRLRPEIPAELEAICLACLEKQPQHRPASAAALAEDLKAWLDDRPMRIRPVPRWRQLIRGAKRRPLVVAAGLVLLVALAVGGFASVGPPRWRPWRKGETLAPAQTSAIELIGATGVPEQVRWWKADKNAAFVLDAEGACAVDVKPLTLIELLPDTAGSRHYRIHAEIRHHRAGPVGFVGLYFAGTTNRTAKAPVLSLLQMSFNDRKDEIETYDGLPQALQAKVPRPRGNRVFFGSRHVAQSVLKPPLDCSVKLADPPCFLASGHGGKTAAWRTVRIDVGPEQVRVFWGDRPVVETSIADVVKRSGGPLQIELRKPRVNDPLKGFVAGLDLQGGLGLFLVDSHASFRNVRFEPQTPEQD